MKRIVFSFFIISQALLVVTANAKSQNNSTTDGRQAFYTIVDAQGNLLTIPVEDKANKPKLVSKQKDKQTTSTPTVLPRSSGNTPRVLQPSQKSATAQLIKQLESAKQARLAKKASQTNGVEKNIAKVFGYTEPARTAHESVSVQNIQNSPSTAVDENRSAAHPVANSVSAGKVSNNQTATPAQSSEQLLSPHVEEVAFVPKFSEVPVNKPADKEAENISTSIGVDISEKQNDGLVGFDDEAYVDSNELVEKQFNLEGKKRFYSLPDGMGGVELVKRESGVDISQYVPKESSGPVFSVSGNYKRLSAQQLTDLLPFACASSDMLGSAQKLSNRKPLNLWPRSYTAQAFAKDIIQLPNNTQQIALVSFANKAKDPSYYWPLAVFLDRKGCVIEAVSQFFQTQLPATWLQQSALKGNLLIPKSASYLLLTPLEQSPDLPRISLVQRGSLTMKVLDNF